MEKDVVKPILLLSFVFILLSACNRNGPEGFADFLPGGAESVSRIEILEGSTGQIRVIVEREQVESFINLLNSLELTRQEDQTPRAGYLYWADFFDGSARLLRITLTGSTVQIDRTIYQTDRPVQTEFDKIYQAGQPKMH